MSGETTANFEGGNGEEVLLSFLVFKETMPDGVKTGYFVGIFVSKGVRKDWFGHFC